MTFSKSIDILCVGEVLIDFIGHQQDVLINQTRDYHRYLGGSPANVVMNSARLGLKSKLVAAVGKDGFGEYIFERLDELGVDTSSIHKCEQPTSIIFVSRSSQTPEFLPYRTSDFLINEEQITSATLRNSSIFHSTCFALSKKPAQKTILKKAEEAYNAGCKLSIDVNFSEKIWNDRDEAINVLKKYCSYNPLVKISDDDSERLFGNNYSKNELFSFFHENGVDIVCLTLGKKGVELSQKGKPVIKMSAIKIKKVMDTTGAGDAFWSGFLFSYLKKKSLEECLSIALKLASLKLQNVGRLPNNINIISQLIE